MRQRDDNMGLPFLITITLIISIIFFLQKKSFSFTQNSIIFMMLTIVTTNYLTIMSLNIKWLKLTEGPFLFIGFILYRDFLIPLLVLIFINMFFNTSKMKNKIFVFILLLLGLQAVELISIRFGIIEYVKWNLFLAAIINFLYLLIGLALAKIVMFAKYKESEHDKSI